MDKVIVGGRYKHFKGHNIKVLCEAKHSETGEDLVVYYCDGPHGSEFKGGYYARPTEMFKSKVDSNKYPDVKQEDRFELVSPEQYGVAQVTTDDNVYISVKNVVLLDEIPIPVKELVSKFVHSMKILDNGLPASGFLGKNGVKITGIFNYGELSFISFVGSKEELEEDTLVHIFSNVSEEEYDQIKAYADGQLEQLKEKEND